MSDLTPSKIVYISWLFTEAIGVYTNDAISKLCAFILYLVYAVYGLLFQYYYYYNKFLFLLNCTQYKNTQNE